PACLRLRVVMSMQQIAEIDANVLLTESLYRQLRHWIESHYRDRLTMDDLQDLNLFDECRTALDELTQLLKIGSIYDFQRT
ncbi:MAG: N-succinylarginine dihydrolase, partial [Pseudomonadota bacterium]|nr:N-succinylarginine dihydrolase [Pseudomonadota bacterium]